MNRNPIARAACLLSCLALAAGMAGCRIHVDKGANGEDKDVQVDTPFGGIHVNTDQTTAADLGLPAYPGAQIAADKEDDKSADIHVGFGEWEMRVMVVNYSSPDSQDKVEAFYKKALGRFGDVITCQDNAPIGTPTVTSEGLSCKEDKHANVQVNDHGQSYGYHSSKNGLELKAGSERHQHIVGFEDSSAGETRIALVAVDLPSGSGDKSGKSN
ncbi:MAG: hypothetical protein WAL45_20700 [Terracidiphilus sp.]